MIHSIGKKHFAPHWHDTYSFGVLDRGGQKWRSRVGHVRGYAGQVINANPGEVHDGRPEGGWREWRMISMEVATMRELTRRCDDIGPPVIDDQELATGIRQVLARTTRWADNGTDSADALAAEEALVSVCVLLLSRHSSTPHAVERRFADMASVRERLADNVAEAPSLQELALLAGMSRYQVLRSFKKSYGLPPHAWLTACRAERARTLITRGMSLSTVAATVGFADQSHMTRCFAKLFGYTPGAWKNSTRLSIRRRPQSDATAVR